MAGPREATLTPGWRLHGMTIFGLASDGTTGIVGPGNSIGAVMQRRKGAPPYIRTFSSYSLRVGQCSL